MKVAELITTINNNMPNDIAESTFLNWINVLEDTMYSKYIKVSDKPELKTISNIGTDELSLVEHGIRWLMLYEYFIYSQICILNEEYGKANNYFMLQNGLIDEFVQYYYPIMDNTVRESRLTNFR